MDTTELKDAEDSLIVALMQLSDCDFDLTTEEQQELYQAQAPIRDALEAVNKLINKYKD